MNPIYLYLLASFIAVFGLLISFKKMVSIMEDKLEKGESVTKSSFQKEYNKFFITAPMIEFIPILLIVFSFIQMEEWAPQITQNDVILPMILIIIILLFGVLNVFLIRRRIVSISNIDSASKNFINTTTFMGISLISSIPALSIIGLILHIS
ncbi:hypothetical protein [Litchfieldia alkalitelluris]|nr:hypothetical protein [Litchfieldia alkalitelluris]